MVEAGRGTQTRKGYKMAGTESGVARHRVRGWLFGAPVLLAAVAAAGAAYQTFATARDLRRHPAPGRMADAGGHGLHLNVAGEGQVRAVRDLGDLPLFVLTAPDNPSFGEMKGRG